MVLFATGDKSEMSSRGFVLTLRIQHILVYCDIVIKQIVFFFLTHKLHYSEQSPPGKTTVISPGEVR